MDQQAELKQLIKEIDEKMSQADTQKNVSKELRRLAMAIEDLVDGGMTVNNVADFPKPILRAPDFVSLKQPSWLGAALTSVVKPILDRLDDLVDRSVNDDPEPVYATKVDAYESDKTYLGEADPGSKEGQAKWRIKRITTGKKNQITTEWAAGSPKFQHKWTDRDSLEYA